MPNLFCLSIFVSLNMSDITRILQVHKGNITKWENELARSNVKVPEHRLQAILNGLSGKIKIFRDIIDASFKENGELADINKAYEFIDNYETLHALASQLLKREYGADTVEGARLQDASVKLPKIEIESFNGDGVKFEQFWSLFEVWIDKNVSLSDASKLSYLVSLLKGKVVTSWLE